MSLSKKHLGLLQRMKDIQCNKLLNHGGYLGLAIGGEAGELQNLLKKRWAGYQPVSQESIKDELADLLNYCGYLMLSEGFSQEEMETACLRNLEKFLQKTSQKTPGELTHE